MFSRSSMSPSYRSSLGRGEANQHFDEHEPHPAVHPSLSTDPTLSSSASPPLFSPVFSWQPCVSSSVPPAPLFPHNSPATLPSLSLHNPYEQHLPVMPEPSYPSMWASAPAPAAHVAQQLPPRPSSSASSPYTSSEESVGSTERQPSRHIAHPPYIATAVPQPAAPQAVSPTPVDILVRRQKQRKADAQRRRREAAVLTDLKQLMAAAEAHIHTGTRREGSEEHDDKQQRVQVLEGTAEGMRQLLRMVEALKQTCEALRQTGADNAAAASAANTAAVTRNIAASVAAVGSNTKSEASSEPRSNETSVESARPFDSYAAPSTYSQAKRMRLLVSTVSQGLDASLGHATLDSNRLIPITVSAIMLDCNDGKALDMNDGMLRYGWSREELIGSTFSAPYEHIMGEVNAYEGPLTDAQYESSKAKKRQLYAGEIGTCVARWRIHMKDGAMYEVESTSWIEGWREVKDEATGVVTRRPIHAIAVTALGDIIKIE